MVLKNKVSLVSLHPSPGVLKLLTIGGRLPNDPFLSESLFSKVTIKNHHLLDDFRRLANLYINIKTYYYSLLTIIDYYY